MATCTPSQASLELAIKNLDNRRRLVEEDRRFQAEDRRTVSTDRGPVRG